MECDYCPTEEQRLCNRTLSQSRGQSVAYQNHQPLYLLVTLNSPTLLFIKLTFIIFYLQLFSPIRWMRISCYIGAAALCSFYGATSITQFVLETPGRNESWATHLVTKASLDSARLATPIAAVGLAFDIGLLILPLVPVVQLQLSTKRKAGVVLVFSTGLM